MKKKFKNEVRIEGKIYEIDLEEKQVANEKSDNFGKNYISGNIKIAVDEAGIDIITVDYSYVAEFTKAGNKNKNYDKLKKLMETAKTIMTDGIEEATFVQVLSNIGLNEFYVKENDEDRLVSQKINQGGAITVLSGLSEKGAANIVNRQGFRVDMFIQKVVEIEANEETGRDEYLKVSGMIFDFKKAVLPVEFIVTIDSAKEYFLSLETPALLEVWGKESNQTIKKEIVTESAFGEPLVDIRTYTNKVWEIVGVGKEVQELDQEDTITSSEMKKALADREVYLASIKARRDEYLAKKEQGGSSNTNASSTGTTTKKGDFNF